MVKLRKLLSDSSKAKRHRRKILNIQITFLGWVVESLGFLVIFLGTLILGHESNIFNFSMQTLTLMIYFVILPSVMLISDFEMRTTIVESNWYGTVLTFFNCNYIKSINNDEEEDISVNNSAEGENSTRDENNGRLAENQEDAIENRNELEEDDAIQAPTEASSSSNNIVVIDLENT